MPFGKRNLIVDHEAQALSPEFEPLPPDATTWERLTFIWKICKRFAILQGVVTFVYHTVATAVLSVGILFINQDSLARLAALLTPYWPLLARAQPYMDAHGHHELFLYMSAMYFKDGLLMAVFSLRHLYWVIVLVIQMRGKWTLDLQFKKATLGLLMPPALFLWIDIQYYGPDQIPGDVLGRSVFDGNIYWGIIGPAFVAPLFLFFAFYSFLLIFSLKNSEYSPAPLYRDQSGEV